MEGGRRGRRWEGREGMALFGDLLQDGSTIQMQMIKSQPSICP